MKEQGLKQLCVSELDEGKYDDIIKDFLTVGMTDTMLIGKVMRLSRGRENPKMVQERIKTLKTTLNT